MKILIILQNYNHEDVALDYVACEADYFDRWKYSEVVVVFNHLLFGWHDSDAVCCKLCESVFVVYCVLTKTKNCVLQYVQKIPW